MKRSLLIALLVISACGSNPEDIFTFEGVLQNAAGTPLRDQRVEYRWSPGTNWAFSNCGRKEPGSTVDTDKLLGFTTTDDAGVWYRQFFRAQFQYQNNSGCLRFSTQLDQTAVTIDVPVESENNQLETLKPWAPGLQSSAADGGTLLTVAIPAFQTTTPLVVDATWRTADGGILWRSLQGIEVDAGPTLAWQVPAEASETGTATLSLDLVTGFDYRTFNETPVPTFGPGGSRAVYVLSQATQQQLPVGPTPVSRGATCDSELPVCPFTDGQLVARPFADNMVTITLPRPAVIRRIALRGIDFTQTIIGVMHADSPEPQQFFRVGDVASGALIADFSAEAADFAVFEAAPDATPLPGTRFTVMLQGTQAMEISLYE